MKINLKQIFNIVGEKKDFSYEIAPEEFGDIKGFSFGSDVSLSGKLYNRAGVVYLDYTAVFKLLHTTILLFLPSATTITMIIS